MLFCVIYEVLYYLEPEDIEKVKDIFPEEYNNFRNEYSNEYSENLFKILESHIYLPWVLDECINKGANDWNDGLRGACYSGNLELIKLMVEKN